MGRSDNRCVVSFFAGAGGLDLGFRKAGFDVVLAVDIESAAVETVNANSKSVVAIRGDVSALRAGHVASELRTRGVRGPVGVIGGPPCQGFSRGNASRDSNDPRNRLPFSYAKLLKSLDAEVGVDFFVFENVVDITRNIRFFGQLKRAFREAGFTVHTAELNARDFGVPQDRRRLFLVGLHEKRLSSARFVFPQGRSRTRTVADAIRGLPAPTFFRRGVTAEEVGHHPNHWTMTPKSPRFVERRFNRWRSFRRLVWSKPSPTVAYGNREIHVHPSGARRLSIYEAMLLQGFPRRYILRGNFSEQVTQVSNAVPPPVAYALARRLRSALGTPAGAR